MTECSHRYPCPARSLPLGYPLVAAATICNLCIASFASVHGSAGSLARTPERPLFWPTVEPSHRVVAQTHADHRPSVTAHLSLPSRAQRPFRYAACSLSPRRHARRIYTTGRRRHLQRLPLDVSNFCVSSIVISFSGFPNPLSHTRQHSLEDYPATAKLRTPLPHFPFS
jgi:hypothetical protein